MRLSILISIFLCGCAFDQEGVVRRNTQREWVYAGHKTEEKQVYCHPTLGSVECFKLPQNKRRILEDKGIKKTKEPEVINECKPPKICKH